MHKFNADNYINHVIHVVLSVFLGIHIQIGREAFTKVSVKQNIRLEVWDLRPES